METTRITFTYQEINQKQCHNPGGISQMIATIENVKDAGMVFSATSIQIQLDYLACTENKWI